MIELNGAVLLSKEEVQQLELYLNSPTSKEQIDELLGRGLLDLRRELQRVLGRKVVE